MKIYNPQPENLIRLMITKSGEKTEYLTLCECDAPWVLEWLKMLFKNTSPFVSGKRTTIQIREAIGGKNGKSMSIAFFGLSPIDVKNRIVNELPKKWL